MIGASVSLILILASALLIGQALAAFAGGATRRRPAAVSWLAPAYGIAALLVLGGIAVRLPGHAVTAAVVLVLATVLAAGYLWRRVGGLAPAAATGAPVVAITVLAAALPFAIAGFIGILGVGLINDDMASHLIIADYIGHYSGHVPSFIKGGYPIGPHAVVAGVARLTGAGLVDVFAGFTVALAPLLGLLGHRPARQDVALPPDRRRLVDRAPLPRRRLSLAGRVQGAAAGDAADRVRALAGRPARICRTPLSEVDENPRPGRRYIRSSASCRRRSSRPPASSTTACRACSGSAPSAGPSCWPGFCSSSRGPSCREDWLRKLAPYALGLLVVIADRDRRRVEPDRRLQPALGAEPGSVRLRPRQPQAGALAAAGARHLAGRRVRRDRGIRRTAGARLLSRAR